MYTREDEKAMILNHRKWPGETLCLKQCPKAGEKVGVMGYAAFGVITNDRPPFTVYLRPNFSGSRQYDSIDALLDDGWIVD